jgi:hypothetical protein
VTGKTRRRVLERRSKTMSQDCCGHSSHEVDDEARNLRRVGDSSLAENRHPSRTLRLRGSEWVGSPFCSKAVGGRGATERWYGPASKGAGDCRRSEPDFTRVFGEVSPDLEGCKVRRVVRQRQSVWLTPFGVYVRRGVGCACCNLRIATGLRTRGEEGRALKGINLKRGSDSMTGQLVMVQTDS